jgi:hypothetical protein
MFRIGIDCEADGWWIAEVPAISGVILLMPVIPERAQPRSRTMAQARRWGAVMLAILLAGCLAPTPFKPAPTRGSDGYTVERLGPGRFRIGFAGNEATSPRQVADSLAYLASQVTLRNDADYFVVAANKMARATTYHTMGGYSEDVYCCSMRGGVTGHEYEASAEITIRKGKAPTDDPAAHDARELAESLAPRMKRGSGFSVY